MIEETRAPDLAVRDGGEFRQETASIASSIMHDGMILGCVSLIWDQSAMIAHKKLQSFGEPPLEIAGKIRLALTR